MDANELRRLLELAAKVAGYAFRIEKTQLGIDASYVDGRRWNPLEDDGDALRLAVKLSLDINPYPKTQEVAAIQWGNATANQKVFEKFGNDPYAATRRAIVRAAAAIGEATP